MVNHDDCNMNLPRSTETRKQRIKPRCNSKRLYRSQSRIAKRERTTAVSKITSDVEVESTNRNEKKRIRTEEHVSSGTTIGSEYEPSKKKRRGARTGLHSQHSIAGSSLHHIYKNKQFNNVSQESVPNLALLPNLAYQISKGKSGSQDVTVTCLDGTKKQIVLDKRVLIHVRETPARTNFSPTTGEENGQRASNGISHALEADEDVAMHKDFGEINVIRPTSTTDLLSVKSYDNLSTATSTGFRLMKSRSTTSKQTVSSSRASSKCISQQSFTCGENFPSTSKTEGTVPQRKWCASYMSTGQEEGSDEDEGFQGKYQPSLKNRPVYSSILSVCSLENPSTCTGNDFDVQGLPKINYVTSAFCISVYVILGIILQKIMLGM